MSVYTIVAMPKKPAEAEKTANDGKQVFQTGNHCVAAPAVDVDKLY